MTIGSLFSGVGGLDMGLEAAGMRVAWQVEIDPQARAVLRKHWPNVDLHEDVRNVGSANLAPVDLICGGFPCQDLSVAGRRAGLAGERSGLFYEFMRVVDELAPRWVLIENVPGLLSSNGGRDMGAVVGTLAELGYGWTYRVLDLQHFGAPQRRRRVFIVGRAGGLCPPEILLEPESVLGDSPARGEAGKVAATLPASGAGTARTGNERTEADLLVAFPLTAREGKGPASSVDSGDIVAHQCQGSNVGEMGTLRRGNGSVTSGVPFVAHTLRAEGFDASEDGTGRGTPIVADTLTARMGRNGAANADRQAVPLAFNAKQAAEDAGDTAPTLRAMPHDKSHPNAGGQVAVAFDWKKGNDRDNPRPSTMNPTEDRTGTLGATREPAVYSPAIAVPRRLTPRECERLMGWPDDWTRYGITDDGREVEMADGPRYRMCGNGVGAPVAEWIARRIAAADTATRKEVTDAA